MRMLVPIPHLSSLTNPRCWCNTHCAKQPIVLWRQFRCCIGIGERRNRSLYLSMVAIRREQIHWHRFSRRIYTVAIRDANGCTSTASATITQPPLLTAAVATVDATCGASEWQCIRNTCRGTAPYTYFWSPGNTTTSSTVPCRRVGYSVVITDANGCRLRTIGGRIEYRRSLFGPGSVQCRYFALEP